MQIAAHRKIWVASVASLMLALAAAGLMMTHGSASAANASVATANGSNRFVPNVVTVNVGDKVTFTYGGTSIHDATSVTGAWAAIPLSSTSASGSTSTFATAGTYYYYCSIHADAADATEAHVTANDAMVGKIIVTAAATPTTPAATATTPAATATTPAATATTPAATPTVVATPSNAPCKLTVADVTVAANTKELVVPFAQQARAGYVAIHESTAAGAPGPVIGFTAQLVAGSQNTNLKVALDRALKDGESVWPMLHTEDNGNTTYDGAAIDKPTVDASCGNSAAGNIVTFPVKVKVTSPAPPAVGNTEASQDGSSSNGLALVSAGLLVAFALAGGSAFAARRRSHRA